MNKLEEAREFLKEVGMPKSQQADICCYVLLAMAGVKPDMQWDKNPDKKAPLMRLRLVRLSALNKNFNIDSSA